MYSLRNPERIKSSEFRKYISDMISRSLMRPVLILKHGRPEAVLISYEEYKLVQSDLYKHSIKQSA